MNLFLQSYPLLGRSISRTCSRLQIVVLLAVGGAVYAQESVVRKPQPSVRPIEIKADTFVISNKRADARSALLPSIETPRFVITGNASIDLPSVEKIPVGEDSMRGGRIDQVATQRGRGPISGELQGGPRRPMGAAGEEAFAGTAAVDLGNFMTTHLLVGFGRAFQDYGFAVDGGYSRTGGWTASTDWSSGTLGAHVSTSSLPDVSFFNGATGSASAGYSSRSYYLYGSVDPGAGRTSTTLEANAQLAGANMWTSPLTLSLGWQNLSLIDSSASVNESLIRLGLQNQIPGLAIPLRSSVNLNFSSRSGTSSGNGLLAEVGVGTERVEVQNFAFGGSLHFYGASGMGGQRAVRVFPHLSAWYGISAVHEARLSFEPSIQLTTLGAMLGANPNLSSTSETRQRIVGQDLRLTLESVWSPDVHTVFTISRRVVEDEPLFADSTQRGVWELAYGGSTTVGSIRGELFAKLTSNDYFACSFEVSSSTNTWLGGEVPYAPRLGVNLSSTHALTPKLRLAPTLSFLSSRRSGIVNTREVGGPLLLGVSCEYRLTREFQATLNVRNLTNQRYEYWQGYPEFPFTISLGCSLKW